MFRALLLITTALALTLFVGCSKKSELPAQPKTVDLGTIDMTYETPSRHDLGDGLTCILTAHSHTPGACYLTVALEKAGKQISSTGAGMIPIGQPCTIGLGYLTLNAVLQVK